MPLRACAVAFGSLANMSADRKPDTDSDFLHGAAGLHTREVTRQGLMPISNTTVDGRETYAHSMPDVENVSSSSSPRCNYSFSRQTQSKTSSLREAFDPIEQSGVPCDSYISTNEDSVGLPCHVPSSSTMPANILSSLGGQHLASIMANQMVASLECSHFDSAALSSSGSLMEELALYAATMEGEARDAKKRKTPEQARQRNAEEGRRMFTPPPSTDTLHTSFRSMSIESYPVGKAPVAETNTVGDVFSSSSKFNYPSTADGIRKHTDGEGGMIADWLREALPPDLRLVAEPCYRQKDTILRTSRLEMNAATNGDGLSCQIPTDSVNERKRQRI